MTELSTSSESDLPELPATPLGRYRHYKGGEYEVIGVARHSETNEPLVVYRPLYNDTGWWVRPHAMFFGSLMVNGVLTTRFSPAVQPSGSAQRFSPAVQPNGSAQRFSPITAKHPDGA